LLTSRDLSFDGTTPSAVVVHDPRPAISRAFSRALRMALRDRGELLRIRTRKGQG
jgi:hypothetical protein